MWRIARDTFSVQCAPTVIGLECIIRDDLMNCSFTTKSTISPSNRPLCSSCKSVEADTGTQATESLFGQFNSYEAGLSQLESVASSSQLLARAFTTVSCLKTAATNSHLPRLHLGLSTGALSSTKPQSHQDFALFFIVHLQSCFRCVGLPSVPPIHHLLQCDETRRQGIS